MLLKHLKDTNKEKGMLCLWVGGVNAIKMSIIEHIQKFNESKIKQNILLKSQYCTKGATNSVQFWSKSQWFFFAEK